MKKAVIYLRVSSREQKQEGFSIPAQRRLLEDFALKNGIAIVKEFEDDETAKRAGRSDFGNMLEYLEKHKDVNIVLVEKTDRLYRNLKDYVTIDELGATVYLVKENEIIGKEATSHQKFIHGIKVLMAKNYVDNLSEEVRKGQREKAELGISPCSMPPLGYIMGDLAGKRGYVVDELNKNLAIKMFEYYATEQYSLEILIKQLYNEGLVIPANFPKSSKLKNITKSSIQRILRNPVYYGAFKWKGKLYPNGIHEPLISKELWDKVQNVLDRYENKAMATRWGTLPFTFKGLLTCGECGRSITAEKKIKKSGKEYVYYRCTKYQTNCSQKPVSEKVLHEQMSEMLKGIKLPAITQEYLIEALKESLGMKRETENVTRTNLEKHKERLLQRLEQMYEDKLDGKISESSYDARFEKYTKEIEGTEQKLARYTKADIDYYKFGVTILELATHAYKLYEMATLEERQELLSFLLSDTQLTDGIMQVSFKKPFNIITQYTMDFRTQENSLTKSKNTLSGASTADWRGGRDSNPQLLA
jgi:site-specific DNA recombinase